MAPARRVTAIIEREDDGFVALCPEFDIASEGASIEEARTNLIEALTLFFETASRIARTGLPTAERWDAAAARTLKRLFPSRKVIGVATREVLLGGGNIHCITQQVPQPAKALRRAQGSRPPGR